MAKKDTLFQKLVDQKLSQTESSTDTLRNSLFFKIFILVGTILGCTFFFIFHLDQYIEEPDKFKLVSGYVWSGQDLTAGFTYPVFKAKTEYMEELSIARETTPLVFLLDTYKEENLYNKIGGMIDSLRTINIESNKSLEEPFTEKALRKYLSTPTNDRQAELRNAKAKIGNFINEVYRNGFVGVNLDKINHSEISVRVPPNREAMLLKSGLHDRGSFLNKLKSFANSEFKYASELIIELLSKNALPNLNYSEELTEKAKQLAEKSVSRTLGIVRKDEVIIKKGDMLTNENIPKINSYQTSSKARNSDSFSINGAIGSIGHSAIIYSILILYLFFIRKKIFYDNYQIGLLSLLLVIVSGIAWITVEISSALPIEYLIILPAFSMLSAIIFDSRTAFYATVTMALMVAGIRGNDYGMGTAMLFAGTLAAYTVRDIQSRTQIFRSIFYIFSGLTFAIVMFGLERSLDLYTITTRSLFALVNAAIAPLLTFGALFLIERVSNIATDLRIKEFDNLNHPLLVKMNETAPGTYQHTLAVALLAERCSQAIGANPLLAKVGAYYHDIGKMAKAEYFTENQMQMGNKHDMLAPKRSAAAIREHVLDGIELARQYKLPQRLIDFIPMHHGTSLIRHFYAKALEDAKEKEIKVSEDDFRYPGPKPNSKETAILMICDSAEAISRITGMDKDAVQEKITQTINEKILDGQFEKSNLTFEEVRIIKDTIFKNIIAKSHQRVQYKELPKNE